MHKSADPIGNSVGDIDWNDLRNALAIARLGSLAAAARALGVDQTTVARRLRILESRVGTPLFERHNGRFAPTPAGEMMAKRGERIEQEIAALRHLGADIDAQVRGVVRLTAVDAIASHYLAGHLAELRARHPALSVELIASSRSLDLFRREADIALRLARPQNGDFVARRVALLSYAVYGATNTPADADWSACDWVAYEHSLAHVPEMRWLADRVSERTHHLPLQQHGRIGHGGRKRPRAWRAAPSGGRASCQPALPVRRRAVLSREIWMVTPRELRHVPRVNAVSDWLVERFQVDVREFG